MTNDELTIEGFCAHFNISKRTVYRAVAMGVIPPPFYNKRNARYGSVHIRAYALARKKAIDDRTTLKDLGELWKTENWQKLNASTQS